MRRALPLIAFTLLAACSTANGRDGEPDNGPKSTRNFSLSDFDGVVLAASDDVRITEGAAFAVSATASDKVLDRLELIVKDGVLSIGRKPRSGGWLNWSDDRGAVVNVIMPVVRSAAITGSGDMTVSATAADTFSGSIAGSGQLSIAAVRAENTELSIAGSGDLTASGKAKRVDLSIAGSGDINAAGLKAETVDASIAGSGDIRANASSQAEASIIGSGDIEISGTKNCKVSKLGSGEIRCVG